MKEYKEPIWEDVNRIPEGVSATDMLLFVDGAGIHHKCIKKSVMDELRRKKELLKK